MHTNQNFTDFSGRARKSNSNVIRKFSGLSGRACFSDLCRKGRRSCDCWNVLYWTISVHDKPLLQKRWCNYTIVAALSLLIINLCISKHRVLIRIGLGTNIELLLFSGLQTSGQWKCLCLSYKRNITSSALPSCPRQLYSFTKLKQVGHNLF